VFIQFQNIVQDTLLNNINVKLQEFTVLKIIKVMEDFKNHLWIRQLQLQSESQRALIYTLNNKGPKIYQSRTPDVLAYEWKRENVRK